MSEEENKATIKLGKSEMVFKLKDKVFQSGSIGLFSSGKMTAYGRAYQVTLILVEIGSKYRDDKLV